ncbi:hypothetical protein [Chitinimonas sp. BJB300]|uniref:hypothetical protein n=1 Tax=Chitinimonas sp. BJB300 TaxID=1559339 RepID=UPI000C0C6735|nr:hypothetical protein [Chitinimonas sp. BJB300]PHV12049.1 hypothetical protein CSQ89_07880 [Chitinimonas sp. BJB300]TSJ84914.1 hypothetical protein FG002_018310 [Chitinimonas sp. BJB300]
MMNPTNTQPTIATDTGGVSPTPPETRHLADGLQQAPNRTRFDGQAKIRETKCYRVEVYGGEYLDVEPSMAVFKITASCAREIVRLAELVKANDIYMVERFDYRVEYFQHDPQCYPEEAIAAGDENSVRTDCNVLVVTKDDFFFRAYGKLLMSQLSAKTSLSLNLRHILVSLSDWPPTSLC